MDKARLERLAELIAVRNTVSKQITVLTSRPAQIGHLGEFIAAEVFDIQLERSAANKGFDGRFRSGPFAGRTVDVKWYAKNEGVIDLRLDDLPDFYLVLAGPAGTTLTSRGDDRPWLIDGVYLFDASRLVAALKPRGCKIGIATSVAQEFWRAARIYPPRPGAPPVLTPEQVAALRLFGRPPETGGE